MDTFQVQVQHQFDQLQAEITTLRAQLALQTTQPPPRLRTRLPDPEKFAGSTYKFDTWLPSIKAKLRVDGEAIGDAIAQFYYVYLNLDSAVQSMVLPQLSRAEEVQRWDYNSILEQLARVYDNPNKQQEAEDKLYSLRQGTDSLPAFIAKFERTLYEAGGQAWPDVNKISNFRNGLNSALRSRLAQQLTLPRAYDEFLRTAQQLSSKTAAPPYITAPKIANDPMDVSELTIGAVMPAARFDKRVTIAAINDDDSGSDSDVGSYDGTRSELEAEVDRMVANRPEIDWRRHVASGAWK